MTPLDREKTKQALGLSKEQEAVFDEAIDLIEGILGPDGGAPTPPLRTDRSSPHEPPTPSHKKGETNA